MKSKIALLKTPKKIEIDEIFVPDISDDQVLLKIKEVGLCGSDVHFYNTGRLKDLAVLDGPIILGHECAGEIASVGKNVKNFKEGDRVAIEAGLPCGTCRNCKAGNYNLCDEIRFMAIPPNNGAFREYMAYDPNYIFKIPDNISFAMGACIEPLSVGYSCAISSKVSPGGSLCILGDGPIGLATLDIARAIGITDIIMSGLDDYHLNVAKEHGAIKTVNVNEADLLDAVRDLTMSAGVDGAVECAGAKKSIQDSLRVLKRGGTVCWLSLNEDIIPISYIDIVCKAVNIQGIFRYKNSYPPIIKMLHAGLINFDKWVSHRFPLEEINKAFETANDPDINKMKITVYMD